MAKFLKAQYEKELDLDTLVTQVPDEVAQKKLNQFALETRTRTDGEGAGGADEDEKDLNEVKVDAEDVVIKRIGVINSTWEQ